MFSMPETTLDLLPDRGPTRAELAAIENEWPQIEADLTTLDAEIGALIVVGRVDELHVRRLRRITRSMLRTPAAGRPLLGGEAA